MDTKSSKGKEIKIPGQPFWHVSPRRGELEHLPAPGTIYLNGHIP
jgi:hypothetical protein